MNAGTRASSVLLGLGLAFAVAGCATSTAGHLRDRALPTSYLAIARPANRALDESFDSLKGERRNLGASTATLHSIAATERHFDRDLLALDLPGRLGVTALRLVRANESRATLTARASHARDLATLDRDKPRLDAMNQPVEAQVRILRRDLGLPPPDTD